VQGDRQVDRQILLREGVDARHDARRRDRNAASPEVQPVRVVDDTDELHGLRIVLQRLAHTHHDDVREGATALARLTGCADDLRHDLPGTQIARETHQASGAECTTDGAAHLAGDADRGPVRVKHEHRFQQLAVPRAVERLDRLAIVCGNGAHRLQRVHGRSRLEFVAQRGRNVLHTGIVTHELAVRPVPDLPCTVRGVPEFLDVGFQLRQGQVK
jgi:hypothetical protein